MFRDEAKSSIPRVEVPGATCKGARLKDQCRGLEALNHSSETFLNKRRCKGAQDSYEGLQNTLDMSRLSGRDESCMIHVFLVFLQVLCVLFKQH